MGPEQSAMLWMFAFPVLFMLAMAGITFLGVRRANANRREAWATVMAVGWMIGLGWLVAIAYLLFFDRRHAAIRRERDRAAPAPLAPTIAAGWHVDPTGRFDHRYWDGRQWTAHVASRGRSSTDPPRPDMTDLAAPWTMPRRLVRT